MALLAEELLFIINLAKAQASVNRKIESRLSAYGLGFSDFIILYHLEKAPQGKLRRIDLAAAIGLTPSGVTRMLAPMEKYGLVTRETNERDARVSYAVITEGGKRLFAESLSSANRVAENLFPAKKTKDVAQVNKTLEELIDLTQ